MPPEVTDISTPLFENAVCLAFTLTAPGMSRPVDPAQIDTDADKTLLHVSKQILVSEEFAAVTRHDEQTRGYLRSRALPFPFKRGIYLMPTALVEQVEAELAVMDQTRQVLIALACRAYPRLIAAIERRLGSLFNPADYPPEDAIRRAYTRDLQYLVISVPTALERVAPEVFKRERVRAVLQAQQAIEAGQRLLRATLYELVGRAVERLTDPANDGKPKVFRDSLVLNLQDYLQVFEARNVVAGDEALAALVVRCREVLADVNARDLRRDPRLREAVQRRMAEVQDGLEKLPPVGGITRRIRFEEDEEDGAA